MSENPAPYGNQNKKSPPERIASFLNTYLGKETLMDIPYPVNLTGPYEKLSEEDKEEFFSFTFHFIYGEAVKTISDTLRIQLTGAELGLIKRRIILFLKSNGFETEG